MQSSHLFKNLAKTRRKGEIYSPSQMERSLPLMPLVVVETWIFTTN